MIRRAFIPFAMTVRRRVPRHLALLALASGALAACASAGDGTRAAPISVSSSELPAIPICRDEMRAYVELTKLAKLHGEGSVFFEPAVDALKQQILDCLDERSGASAYRAL